MRKRQPFQNLFNRDLIMQREYKNFFNGPFIFMLVFYAVAQTTYGMISPILAKHITGMGIALSTAGFIAGVVAVTSLVVRPFSGFFADHTNKKHVLIIATSLMGLGSILLGFVRTVPGMLISRIVQGAGYALNGTCVVAMTVDYMPKDRVSEGLGYLGIANIIGLSAGPTLGLELASRIGSGRAIISAGSCVLISTVLMAFFRYKPEPVRAEENPGFGKALKQIRISDLFSAELLPFMFFVAAFSFANSIVSNYLALTCEERGLSGYSLYFTINAVTLILIRPFVGKLQDRKGLSIVLIPAYLIAAAGTVWIIYLAAILKAVGVGSGQPAVQAECLRRLGPQRRGIATSSYYIGADVANGIGPAVGGLLASNFGYTAMFAASASLMIVMLTAYIVFIRAEKKKTEVN